MQTPTLVILTGLCVLLLLLMTGLVLLLVRVLHTQLVDLRIENQKLRNQLRSSSPSQLAGLNSATLPSTEQPEVPVPAVDSFEELDTALMDEERLARQGFMTGDVGYDLSAAGWSSPVLRRTGNDGDPVAYDPT